MAIDYPTDKVAPFFEELFKEDDYKTIALELVVDGVSPLLAATRKKHHATWMTHFGVFFLPQVENNSFGSMDRGVE